MGQSAMDQFLAGELVDNPIDTKKIKDQIDQIPHLRLTFCISW